MNPPDRDTARDDLERALRNISEFAAIYEKLAEDDEGFVYLADRLRDHHGEAMGIGTGSGSQRRF